MSAARQATAPSAGDPASGRGPDRYDKAPDPPPEAGSPPRTSPCRRPANVSTGHQERSAIADPIHQRAQNNLTSAKPLPTKMITARAPIDGYPRIGRNED